MKDEAMELKAVAPLDLRGRISAKLWILFVMVLAAVVTMIFAMSQPAESNSALELKMLRASLDREIDKRKQIEEELHMLKMVQNQYALALGVVAKKCGVEIEFRDAGRTFETPRVLPK